MLSRRRLASLIAAATLLPAALCGPPAMAGSAVELHPAFTIDPATRDAWLKRWQTNMLAEIRERTCDSAMGEQIGWLVAPVLEGLCDGYLATGDARWIDHLVDWTDAWIRRGVTEPDGYVGWPKFGAAGTDVDDLDSFYADSLLGEAMVLRPVVLAAAAIRAAPALDSRYGRKAAAYIALARRMFEKWDRRGAWRAAGDGMISVVLPYGIDPKTGQWTAKARDRDDLRLGFSHPDNKANMVAMWLLAMTDATGDPAYRDRAGAWFRLMKARLHLQANGTYRIWNYWEPAGPWDYHAPGRPKHWVGVHPNPGYYEIDVKAMVTAARHRVVFNVEDIGHLIRTALVTGRSWAALAPYDATLRARFERALDPDGWQGLVLVPWYLAQQRSSAPWRTSH